MNVFGPELSVVVLCYRAEELLYRVTEPLAELLRELDVTHELILVANAWTDGDRTPELAADWARGRPNVTVVAQPKAGGVGWDLRTGLDATRGRTIVYLDGDGQVPTAAVAEAYRVLVASGCDLVKGRRTKRGDGAVRALVSAVYNVAFRLLFGTVGLGDINGQPKAMTRDVYERLELVSDDWFVEAEVVLRARELGLAVVEFPVDFLPNVGRTSLVGWDTVWEFVRNMARWRVGRHPAQRPRRVKTQPTGARDRRERLTARGRTRVSRPPRACHRRPGLHRLERRAPPRRARRRGHRRGCAHPRARRQPVQHPRRGGAAAARDRRPARPGGSR